MQRPGAAWEDLQAGGAHHSGAGGFVLVAAAGLSPVVSAQLLGFAVVEGAALWPRHIVEECLGRTRVNGRTRRKVLTQGGCAAVVAEELCRPHSPGMPETLWMSSHWYVLPHLCSSGRA